MAAVAGLAAIVAKLGALRDGMLPAAGEGMAPGISAAVNNAARLCPVDTGELKRSIESRKSGVARAEIRALAPYAAIVEMGAESAPARPFMYPAYALAKDDIVRGAALAVKDLI